MNYGLDSGIYTQHVDFLFHSSTFMFFVSYLYGYGISFIFGTKKTFAISFFIGIITSILILIYESGFILITHCFMTTGNNCFEPASIMFGLMSWLTIFIANLFINILVGIIGVSVGILLYFPSEYILDRFFGVKFHEDMVIHNEDYAPTQTSARASHINTFLKLNRPTTNATTDFSKTNQQIAMSSKTRPFTSVGQVTAPPGEKK